MVRRHRLVLVALVTWCWSAPGLARPLPTAAPAEVGLSEARLARIRPVIEEEIARKRMPGAVLLVARKGKVAYLESFGFLDQAKGIRMPRDAIFRLYSMTKPFTSVAALMLAEEGRLLITDPVSRHLPAFKEVKVAVPRVEPSTGSASYQVMAPERAMTVHDLLRHTSGLAYAAYTANEATRKALQEEGFGPESAASRKLQAADWTERLARVPLAHQPGTTWEYGLSTDLLGRVIEAVSGKRLGDFLAERLFAPLGMADTAFSVPAGKAARLAWPYPADPETGQPIELIDVSAPAGNDMGGNGAVSTAVDYFRFCQLLLDGGRQGQTRLLSRTTVKLMTSDHLGGRPAVPWAPGRALGPGIDDYGFGLGVAVRLTSGAGVPGSVGEYFWPGYGGTFFWIDPAEQLVVIYLSQAPGPSSSQPRRLIKQLVTQAIND